MINFLSGRSTPSRFLTNLPDVARAFGEKALLEEYRRSPPDLILIVHRDATEHGATLFGRDYGLETVAWIDSRYTSLARFGGSPFDRGTYGMHLLARNGSPIPGASPR